MTLKPAFVMVWIAATQMGAVAPDTQGAVQPVPRILRVTSVADDDREGTLRWAVNTSNATPQLERIEVEPIGQGPHVITLKAALPPIKGPVQIEGTAWRRTGEYAVIAGSGYVAAGGPEQCPGATPGQYGANVRTTTSPGLHFVDTADAEITGVEIRGFCIGILINRSKHIEIRDSRITVNRGGAGVMLTGDDGLGNATSTTTVHNKVIRNEFIDNGDGLELTRGAAFNLVADNVFRSTPANPEPSQGIEILRGDDNVVSGNRFEGYSDGLQINWGDRNHIVANTFTGNTYGLNLTGIGNVIDRNVVTGNRIGIVVRPADPMPVVRLTRNRLSGNGREIRRCEAGGSCDPAAPKGPIIFGLPGLEHEAFIGSRGRGVIPNPASLQRICPQAAPACQAAPNGGLQAPTLTSVHTSHREVSVNGTLSAAANKRYVLELFANGDDNGTEAEIFLADAVVYTDARGQASFTQRVEQSSLDRAIRSITAAVTSPEGATSPLSAALRIE